MSFLNEPVEVYSYPPLPNKKKLTPVYEYQEFPCGVFNANGRDRIAKDQDDLDMLITQGWSRTPFPEPEAKVETCPNCNRLKVKYDMAWNTLSSEHSTLEAAHAELEAEYKATHENYLMLDGEHRLLIDKCAALEAQLNKEPEPGKDDLRSKKKG